VSNPLSIFVIDDDRVMLQLIEVALSLDPTILTRTIRDSDDALKALVSADYRPDCIILDVMMPDVNGKLLLGEIRMLPNHGSTPVIFLTANKDADDRSSYTRLGALGVIRKPFDPLTLAQDVRALL
jgi:two-component system OmpR family response regulator